MATPLQYLPRTRLIWMDAPTAETAPSLAAELEDHHSSKFMVYNVSGSGDALYSPDVFGDAGRVVSLRYPGHLCPPVMMLVEACSSIHSFLKADAANYAAIHCRAGRGRSAVLLSCLAAFLAVRGEHDGPKDPIDWLSILAQLRGQDEQALTLPTHRRYLQYFSELLHSGPPSGAGHAGCELRGVTLHAFPTLPTPPCVVITAGTRTLFASTAAQVAELPDAANEPKSRSAYSYRGDKRKRQADESSSSSSFPLVEADAVLTLREENKSGPLLCRAGFHVDFAASAGVLRLQCRSLDGGPSRLPADAFIDIVLAPRQPAPGADDSGGMLAVAVEMLRRAGVASGGGKAARAAFGGSKQPPAKFSFGEDDEEVVVAMPAAAPKKPPKAPAPAPVAAAPAPTTSSAASTSVLSPADLLSKYAPATEAPTSAAAPVAEAPSAAVAPSSAAPAAEAETPSTDDVDTRIAALKAEAVALRAAGDKHGALAKVREMKALQEEQAPPPPPPPPPQVKEEAAVVDVADEPLPPPPPEAPPPVPPPAAAAVTPAEDAKPKDRDTLDAEIEAELADGDYDEASAAAIDQEFDDLF